MICLEPSTRRGRKFEFKWGDRADSLVGHCDPTLEAPTVTYRYSRRKGLPIPPYIHSLTGLQSIDLYTPCTQHHS